MQSAILAEASTHGQAELTVGLEKSSTDSYQTNPTALFVFSMALLTWLWQTLYGGIDVRYIELATSELRSPHRLYALSSKSYGLSLAVLCALPQWIDATHIAAGDNLNLPLVGPLLRRAGAFFMRRTFGMTTFTSDFHQLPEAYARERACA